MSQFRLIPLGVGDAFSELWYSSSVLIEAEDTRLLIDCPHPIRKIMREAGQTAGETFDARDIAGVLLTHLHADHCSGLEGLGYFYHFACARRASIYAHPTVTQRLWSGSLAAGMERLSNPDGQIHEYCVDDYFEIHPLTFAAPTQIGPFAVECRATVHPIPTTAFRITAAGRTLGYSADTAFDRGLIDWLAEADRFVHETNYGIHTPYERLAALPADIRERMWLIHYPDDFPLERSVIEPLRPGHIYAV